MRHWMKPITFFKSSFIRAESHQKQQTEAGYYQAAEWGQVYDSTSTRRDSIIQMCSAQ